jgi:hypothetical protein
MLKISADEIEKAKTKNGGWTAKTLKAWGIGWPPPKGWKQALIAGKPVRFKPRKKRVSPPKPKIDGWQTWRGESEYPEVFLGSAMRRRS